MENIEKWIAEAWFPEHKATLTQHGDLQVLHWGQEGTGAYHCRYVFDGDKMYISGDIGEAVFWLTWKASIHSFDNVSIYHFMEKLSAYSRERMDFNASKAVEELEKWKKGLIEDEVDFDAEEFEEMIGASESCSNKDEWSYEYVNGLYYDFITELDPDYWEWIYNIGDKIPCRIIGYLVGLKMASKQLKTAEVVIA